MHLDSVLEKDHWDPQKKVLLIIDAERAKLIDHAGLFGDSVSRAFPSAENDIREAGNCLAAECNTAAVFHLMRVAELGVRALALDRRVKLPKRQPFDLAGWEAIISGLESAEADIRKYPKTPAQEAQYAFHHLAMVQFARFKSEFRDQVTLARQQFGPEQAIKVFEDVREFMQTLANRIGENSRTPLVWKGKKWVER